MKACPEDSNGKWVLNPAVVKKQTRWMPKWPTKVQNISAIHLGHRREDQQNMQGTGCTDSLHSQEYLQEIPHESERVPGIQLDYTSFSGTGQNKVGSSRMYKFHTMHGPMKSLPVVRSAFILTPRMYKAKFHPTD